MASNGSTGLSSLGSAAIVATPDFDVTQSIYLYGAEGFPYWRFKALSGCLPHAPHGFPPPADQWTLRGTFNTSSNSFCASTTTSIPRCTESAAAPAGVPA